MAENREFIAAKDLPIIETEEVNALVVDPATGELGLKAGANLGGSGGVIELEMELNDTKGYYFKNIEQVQDIIDKNMNLYIIVTYQGSNFPSVMKYSYSCMKDTLVIGDNSGTPYAYRYMDCPTPYDYGMGNLRFDIDEIEYTNNAIIKVIDSQFDVSLMGLNVVKAYASFV